MALKIGRGLQRVSVIHADDTYGREVANSFEENFEKEGGKVTAMVAYKEGKDSYRNEIGQALQGEPEFINLIAHPVDGAEMLKEALENQWARYFFFSDSMKSIQVIELVGVDLMEGFRGTEPAMGEGQSERIFTEAYQNKFHTNPQTQYVKNTYDAMALIALAIQRSGKAEGKAIRDNLREVSNPPGERIFAGEFSKAFENLKDGGEINYEGASGSVDIDQNGDVKPPFEIWKIEEGNFVREELIRFE
jgi:ABC-type branched-subunit amino acid transport system substrate-binding protein